MKDSLVEAKKYALRLLRYRDRTEKEIKERLSKKGFNDKHINFVIESLKEAGLINDIKYAISIKENALKRKFLSFKSAKYYAMHKGLSKEIVEQIFNEDFNNDVNNARRLIAKKMKIMDEYPRETKLKKLYNLLLRKGYSNDIIQKVLREINLL